MDYTFVVNKFNIYIMIKKIAGTTLLILVPLFIGAQSFTFNADRDTENWVSFGSSTKHVTNGVLKYTPVTPTKDANIQYKKGIKAKKAKYVHIVLNSHSAITNTLTFEFRNKTATLISTSIDPDKTGFVTYHFKLDDKTDWTGTVNDIRIRLRSKVHTDPTDYYEFDQIVFNNHATLKN